MTTVLKNGASGRTISAPVEFKMLNVNPRGTKTQFSCHAN